MKESIRLRPGNTLLAVIDIQERLVPAARGGEELLAAATRLVEGCRLLGVPILISEQYPKGLGATMPQIKAAAGENGAAMPQIVEKADFNALNEPRFAEALKEALPAGDTPQNIIACGIESHVCVLQSAMGFLREGYNVYIAADAVGSRRQYDLDLSLRRMEAAGAIITTMEAILFELLEKAGTPLSKEIIGLVK